ncbi:aminopeptidase [Bhargavaea cecembensis DSE10]|uniref:Aminopeptidase n=1 Tax=Bhargavaea cecembensis DSE10 TaxID=1235279 RepID=M7NY30_9BACL|nr:M24 family metallopeptidase [Bhargavaea cecembensis]EMR06590.1 aminopeptidase [Bhargavaea cecembensis DSE10]
MQAVAGVVQKRFDLLEKRMEQENLDAVIVYGRGMVTQYGYLYYFANYYPILRPGFVIKVKGEEPIAFYTTRADYYLAKERGSIEDVRYAGIGDVVDSKNGIMEQISSLLNEKELENIGICGLNSLMSYAEASYFKENLKGNVIDGTNLIQEMKAVKFEEEHEQVRETFEIAELSFAEFEKHIAGGKTPAEIAAEVDKVARAHGSISTLIFLEDGPYFLRKPTLTPLRQSGLLTAFAEIVGPNGSWVEKGGLFALGKLTKEEEEIGNACVAAMYAVKEAIRPGIKVSELARIITEKTEHLNVNPGIWHGHGVGVDHDSPIIREDSDAVIEPGMVISVHPNFSNQEETIGASLADVFLIHEDRAESLSKRSYDITYL